MIRRASATWSSREDLRITPSHSSTSASASSCSALRNVSGDLMRLPSRGRIDTCGRAPLPPEATSSIETTLMSPDLSPLPRGAPVFPGVGTVVNVVTVLLGSAIGVLLGHRIPDRVRDLVMDALGLVTLLIGGSVRVGRDRPRPRRRGAARRPGADRPRRPGHRRRGRLPAPDPGAGRVGRRLPAAPAGRPGGLGGPASLHRGLRRRVPGLLHRSADRPRLAERRSRQRRRAALPQGHPGRLRRDRVRGDLRLGRGRERASPSWWSRGR